MRGHRRENLIGQRSNSLVLWTIVSALTANVPQASADASLPSQEEILLQEDPVAVISRPRTHFRRSKSESRPPNWAYDPPLARLERNLYHDKFAQLLKIQHTPPAAIVPTERPSEIVNDDDEDRPRSTDPNYQPVPTKWLMLGYSRVNDIPTSPPTETITRGCRRHARSSSPASNPPDSSVMNIIAPCKTARGSQTDWMQKPQAQAIGALTLFLIAVFIMESVIYLWRGYCRGRATAARRGRLALEGDEKQLRAFAEDTRSKAEAPSVGSKPPV